MNFNITVTGCGDLSHTWTLLAAGFSVSEDGKLLSVRAPGVSFPPGCNCCIIYRISQAHAMQPKRRYDNNVSVKNGEILK
jgi:hypothetical protein